MQRCSKLQLEILETTESHYQAEEIEKISFKDKENKPRNYKIYHVELVTTHILVLK